MPTLMFMVDLLAVVVMNPFPNGSGGIMIRVVVMVLTGFNTFRARQMNGP